MLERLEPGDGQRLFSLVDQNRDFIAIGLSGFARSITPETAAYRCDSSYSEMRKGRKLDYLIAYEGTPVGQVKLGASPAIEKGEAVMTYWLAEAASGQGIMTLAARRLIDYGFEERDMSTARLDILHANKPSWRLAERLGAVIVPPSYECARNYDVWKVFPDA
jgi:RimJ/RimL family protein N-acetyltransferase